MSSKFQEQREKLVKQLEDLDKKIEDEKAKKLISQEIKYTNIPELKIEISQQIYNEKTYEEIVKLVGEENIATYEELFTLRKLTDKYSQFKKFWVFVPNPDKISKDNSHVAWFYADSGWAGLYCDWDPSITDDGLGVFVVRRKKIRKVKK